MGIKRIFYARNPLTAVVWWYLYVWSSDAVQSSTQVITIVHPIIASLAWYYLWCQHWLNEHGLWQSAYQAARIISLIQPPPAGAITWSGSVALLFWDLEAQFYICNQWGYSRTEITLHKSTCLLIGSKSIKIPVDVISDSRSGGTVRLPLHSTRNSLDNDRWIILPGTLRLGLMNPALCINFSTGTKGLEHNYIGNIWRSNALLRTFLCLYINMDCHGLSVMYLAGCMHSFLFL